MGRACMWDGDGMGWDWMDRQFHSDICAAWLIPLPSHRELLPHMLPHNNRINLRSRPNSAVNAATPVPWELLVRDLPIQIEHIMFCGVQDTHKKSL